MTSTMPVDRPRPRSLRAVAVGAALLAGLAAQAPPNATSPLGTNLASVTYYSSELVFVDLMKQSSAWIPQKVVGGPWDTGAELDIDADGWIRSLKPDQAAGLLMARSIDGHYPGGRHLCLYDGDGDLRFGFDATLVKAAPGRAEVDVTPSGGGVYLKLVRTNPSDPLRNIRFIPAAAEKTYSSRPFQPLLLDKWKWFRVLRFMDWGRTNDTAVARWAQRTSPDRRSQAGSAGVAYEHMIALANELDADPWICVPHLADDDFVRRLATLVRDRLKPGLRVRVEYSNEVWNPLYPAYAHAELQGQALNLSSDKYEGALRYYARRAVEIFAIFTQVVGRSRLYRVISAQSANPWTAQTALDWQQAGNSADALAIAPYFGLPLGEPKNAARTAQMTDLELFYALYLDLARSLRRVPDHAGHARRYGLDLISYEGGQSLVGQGSAQSYQPLTDRLVSANRHFAMLYVYDLYLSAWRRAGGRLFVHYSSTGRYTRWGSWGAFEWADQNPRTAWKFLGMLTFWSRNPKWW